MAEKKKNLVVLTGAGVSQESGIKTFRDANGLWENHRLEDVASPEAFARNPKLVHEFYNLRRAQLKSTKPNAAHLSLAKLEAEWPGNFLLVSQNVDDLHERAGSKKLFSMHGQLTQIRCSSCEAAPSPHHEDLSVASVCPLCQRAGGMRPHIVWFGEVPLFLDEIYRALSQADIFVAIGTSGNVYPAAGFVSLISSRARTIELNAAGTEISRAFAEHRRGPASITVPALVKELLEPT
ncbi:MAG: NAD-dependent deacylase [Proteobacteria bacterium]|nr:MAG: NAD-dependent deacylase [Pseudomonadota bacterium]